jgi:hypothetical protein
MTEIKKDPRVYKQPIAPAPEPEEEKPVAKEATPKATPSSKKPRAKRKT